MFDISTRTIADRAKLLMMLACVAGDCTTPDPSQLGSAFGWCACCKLQFGSLSERGRRDQPYSATWWLQKITTLLETGGLCLIPARVEPKQSKTTSVICEPFCLKGRP
eukprot:3795868-Amphidinium_carterae.1